MDSSKLSVFHKLSNYLLSFHVLYLLLGTEFLAGGGEGGPTLCVSGFLSGGLPEWGHLGNLGLESGCSVFFQVPGGLCPALVSW